VSDAPRNKAERLAVAGSIAPTLRENAEVSKSRRVARVDKDGRVVGYTTWAEVQRSILERAKIEMEVADGVTPDKVICKHCGKLIPVKKNQGGGRPSHCKRPCAPCPTPGCKNKIHDRTVQRGGKCLPCATGKRPQPVCVGCGKDVSRSRWAEEAPRCWPCRTRPKPLCADCGAELRAVLMTPCQIRRRKGAPPRCKPCANRVKLEAANAARLKKERAA
jgi:hypothetical protein